MAYFEKTPPSKKFPKGGWKVSYRGPDGKERSKTRRTKVEAETWLATEQADRSRGVYIDLAAGRVTLADYAATWTARMGPTWRTSTAAGVANSLDKHILPVLGRRPVPAFGSLM